ncbi:PfkB family carbohydrate kinase [Kribbella sp. NPDC004138]
MLVCVGDLDRSGPVPRPDRIAAAGVPVRERDRGRRRLPARPRHLRYDGCGQERRRTHRAVPRVGEVRDTTGAGDAFAAAFLTAVLADADMVDVVDAVSAGHTLAQRVLAEPGATLSTMSAKAEKNGTTGD